MSEQVSSSVDKNVLSGSNDPTSTMSSSGSAEAGPLGGESHGTAAERPGGGVSGETGRQGGSGAFTPRHLSGEKEKGVVMNPGPLSAILQQEVISLASSTTASSTVAAAAASATSAGPAAVVAGRPSYEDSAAKSDTSSGQPVEHSKLERRSSKSRLAKQNEVEVTDHDIEAAGLTPGRLTGGIPEEMAVEAAGVLGEGGSVIQGLVPEEEAGKKESQEGGGEGDSPNSDESDKTVIVRERGSGSNSSSDSKDSSCLVSKELQQQSSTESDKASPTSSVSMCGGGNNNNTSKVKLTRGRAVYDDVGGDQSGRQQQVSPGHRQDVTGGKDSMAVVVEGPGRSVSPSTLSVSPSLPVRSAMGRQRLRQDGSQGSTVSDSGASLALSRDSSSALSRDSSSALSRDSSCALSRDSSFETGQTYTDSTGVNLEEFIVKTLHKNKSDRAMLLNLEAEMIAFIRDTQSDGHKFPPMSSYHRMLVHRIAAFFGLDHNVDDSGKCVTINRLPCTRIPDFHFRDHIREDIVMDELQPKKQILKRHRDCTSLEEQTLSADRISVADRKSKSFEEREEEYLEVRNRIFPADDEMSRRSHEGSGEYSTCRSSRLAYGSTTIHSRSSRGEDPRGGRYQAYHLSAGVSGALRPWSSTDSSSGYSTDGAPCARLGMINVPKASSFHGEARGGRLAKTDSLFGNISSSSSPIIIPPIIPPSPPPVEEEGGGFFLPRQEEEGSDIEGVESGSTSQTRDSPFLSFTSEQGERLAIWVATTIDLIPPGSFIINPRTGQPYLNSDGSHYRWYPPSLSEDQHVEGTASDQGRVEPEAGKRGEERGVEYGRREGGEYQQQQHQGAVALESSMHRLTISNPDEAHRGPPLVSHTLPHVNLRPRAVSMPQVRAHIIPGPALRAVQPRLRLMYPVPPIFPIPTPVATGIPPGPHLSHIDSSKVLMVQSPRPQVSGLTYLAYSPVGELTPTGGVMLQGQPPSIQTGYVEQGGGFSGEERGRGKSESDHSYHAISQSVLSADTLQALPLSHMTVQSVETYPPTANLENLTLPPTHPPHEPPDPTPYHLHYQAAVQLQSPAASMSQPRPQQLAYIQPQQQLAYARQAYPMQTAESLHQYQPVMYMYQPAAAGGSETGYEGQVADPHLYEGGGVYGGPVYYTAYRPGFPQSTLLLMDQPTYRGDSVSGAHGDIYTSHSGLTPRHEEFSKSMEGAEPYREGCGQPSDASSSSSQSSCMGVAQPGSVGVAQHVGGTQQSLGLEGPRGDGGGHRGGSLGRRSRGGRTRGGSRMSLSPSAQPSYQKQQSPAAEASSGSCADLTEQQHSAVMITPGTAMESKAAGGSVEGQAVYMGSVMPGPAHMRSTGIRYMAAANPYHQHMQNPAHLSSTSVGVPSGQGSVVVPQYSMVPMISVPHDSSGTSTYYPTTVSDTSSHSSDVSTVEHDTTLPDMSCVLEVCSLPACLSYTNLNSYLSDLCEAGARRFVILRHPSSQPCSDSTPPVIGSSRVLAVFNSEDEARGALAADLGHSAELGQGHPRYRLNLPL